MRPSPMTPIRTRGTAPRPPLDADRALPADRALVGSCAAVVSLGLADERVRPCPGLDAFGQPSRRRLTLDQVLERAELQAPRDQLLFAVVADDHHGDVPRPFGGAKLFEEREAIHSRQPDVEEDQI